MTPEMIGLAAFLRTVVLLGGLWLFYLLVKAGARWLPDGRLRAICIATLQRATERRMSAIRRVRPRR